MKAPFATSDRSLNTCCQSLLNATGAGIGMIDRDGRVVECNDAFAQLYAHRTAGEAEGHLLTEFAPGPAGEERLLLVRRAIAHSRPIVFDELWNGLKLRGTILPADPTASPLSALPPVATLIVRTAHAIPGAIDPARAEVVQTQHVNLGPLANLSRRELEVLAFIGAGLTNHEIANRIYRSDKTVEWHRSQLGAKLNASTRVELARIADRAGLREWLDQHGGEPLGPQHADERQTANEYDGAIV